MIRPEVHQAFGEGSGGQRGALRARQDLCAVMGLIGFADSVEYNLRIRAFRRGCLLNFLAFVACRNEAGEYLIGRRQG